MLFDFYFYASNSVSWDYSPIQVVGSIHSNYSLCLFHLSLYNLKVEGCFAIGRPMEKYCLQWSQQYYLHHFVFVMMHQICCQTILLSDVIFYHVYLVIVYFWVYLHYDYHFVLTSMAHQDSSTPTCPSWEYASWDSNAVRLC